MLDISPLFLLSISETTDKHPDSCDQCVCVPRASNSNIEQVPESPLKITHQISSL